ncbi:TrmH family RNA methyltransferase [Microbacteriaceae bacterium]|nr:TrmH family RNA methyltransferase [Candidatus Saccharibacteria bacterium]
MQNEDTRNVIDAYKGMPIEEIINDLDDQNHELEIAIENLERDFNMGTIVRSANAFGVRKVHIIGRKQWNKRGAMMTDKYVHVVYHSSIADFYEQNVHIPVIGIDNIDGSRRLNDAELPKNCILLFGAEGPGLSKEALQGVQYCVAIEQFGSTRSINVGVAAGIVMYEWVSRNVLS